MLGITLVAEEQPERRTAVHTSTLILKRSVVSAGSSWALSACDWMRSGLQRRIMAASSDNISS